MKNLILKLQLLLILTVQNFSYCQDMDSLKSLMKARFKNEKFMREDIFNLKDNHLPPFQLQLLNGQNISSEPLKGKPSVINFWFVNCQHCLTEMPIFNVIKSKFEDKVNFIAMTFETPKEVVEFLKVRDFNFTHIVNANAYIETLGFIGYPKTLILDKNLVVRDIKKSIPKESDNHQQNLNSFENTFIKQLTELLNQ